MDNRSIGRDSGALLLRVVAGLSLSLGHGLGKLPPSPDFISGVAEMGFPAAPVFAWAAGVAEGVGGILLAVGLLTRPASFFILTTMLVAVILRQAGDPFGERELPLLFATVAAYFLLAGPGRFSADAALARSGLVPARTLRTALALAGWTQPAPSIGDRT